MFRSALGKVMWVGRATVFLVGLAVILALLFGAATTALAGTGLGATFNLGKKNTVDRLSQLVGNTAGAMLKVDNDGTGTALDLRVGDPAAAPATKTTSPMKVDSQAVVTNLNADKLDNLNSTDFLPGGSLPSGRTIRGSYAMHWTAGGVNHFQSDSISFGFTLASAPTPHFVAKDATAPEECPGSVSTPEADPGHLCIYEAFTANLSEVRVCDPVIDTCSGASRYGAAVVLLSAASGLSGSMGTWAVTAP